jgi:conjugal transfer/entry exclusion protein
MPSPTEKEQIIRKLSQVMQSLIKLETRLRLQKKETEADNVAKKCKALQKEIDNLLKHVIDEWLGAASKVLGDIKTASDTLQTSIANIQKKLEVAKNVVKVIGLVDDVIGFAKTALTGS